MATTSVSVSLNDLNTGKKICPIASPSYLTRFWTAFDKNPENKTSVGTKKSGKYKKSLMCNAPVSRTAGVSLKNTELL